METTHLIIGAARTFGLAALIAMMFGWAMGAMVAGNARVQGPMVFIA